MSRQVKDAREITTGDLIYFRGHAKATYMSDGRTVEDALANAGIPDTPSDDVIYGRKNGEWVDVNQEFEPIGTIKTSEIGNIYGDKYLPCDGSLIDLADYPDIPMSNYPAVGYGTKITGYSGSYSSSSDASCINRYLNGYYVTALQQALGYIYFSTDLKTWQSSLVSSNYIYDINYINGKWYAVSGRYLYTSNDLISWNIVFLATEPTSNDYSGVISYANNTYVCCLSGCLYTSTNGTTWTFKKNLGNYGATILEYFKGYWLILIYDLVYSTLDFNNYNNYKYINTHYWYDCYRSKPIIHNELLLFAGPGGVYSLDHEKCYLYRGSDLINYRTNFCIKDNTLLLFNSSSIIVFSENNILSRLLYATSSYGGEAGMFIKDSNIYIVDPEFGNYIIQEEKYLLPSLANSYIKVLK